MPTLRAPVRRFQPMQPTAADSPAATPPRQQPSAASMLPEMEASDYQTREMEGDEAEYAWLDSIIADEFQTAFSDSVVLPLWSDTPELPSRCA